MSDKRTSAKVNEEYGRLAFKAGNLQYQIACEQKDLEAINEQLRDLSLEYTAAKNAEEPKVSTV